MSILITYQSKTGFTQKYAEWISQKLGCKMMKISEVKPEDVSRYDLLIHGGWIMGGMINGLDKVRGMSPQHLIAFGVGFTDKESADVNQIREANKLGETPFFYFEGGMNPPKMGFMGRLMVKMVTKKTPEYTDHTNEEDVADLVKLALSVDSE